MNIYMFTKADIAYSTDFEASKLNEISHLVALKLSILRHAIGIDKSASTNEFVACIEFRLFSIQRTSKIKSPT